jgi:hypothetical protein
LEEIHSPFIASSPTIPEIARRALSGPEWTRIRSSIRPRSYD